MNEDFHHFTKYQEDSAFEDAVHTAFQNLLVSNEMAYNPYPQLVQHFRRYIERFTHINKDKFDTIFANEVIPTSVPHLYTLQGCQRVWGISKILATIDESILQNFRWLLDTIILSPSSLYVCDNYSNQVMVSLGGPIIFQTTFYPEPHTIQVFQEHLIIGPKKEKAISIFVETIFKDVEMIRKSPLHFFIELWIGEENSDEKSSRWNPDQIDRHNEILVQNLTKAVEDFGDIKLKCIFRLCAELPNYCSGEKIFKLSFMKTFPSTEIQETLETFSRYPTSTLYQSVFLHQNHAEAFFSLNQQNLDSEDHEFQFLASGYQISMTSEAHTSSYSKPLPLPKKNKSDSDDARFQSIFQNLIIVWQKRISTNQELTFFDTVYHTILLYIFNSQAYPSELLRELYQLLHCDLEKLNSLIKKTEMLQDLSKELLKIGDTSAFIVQLNYLKQYAQNFLLYSKEERSSNIICLGQTFNTKVSQIIEATVNTPEQVTFLLKELHQYLQAPFLEMLEDTSSHCHNFLMLVSCLKDFFQDSPNYKRKKKSPRNLLQYKILHETDHINLNDQDRLVVNINECLPGNPNEISKSKVLIKYFLDVHLDEVWEEYLMYILIEKPTNPFAKLISKFRQSAMKMHLFSYSNEKLYKTLSEQSRVDLVDNENYVYCLPDAFVYGPITALVFVDASILRSILASIPHFWNQTRLQKTEGSYKVTISLGIGGWTLLYGRVQPYINEIRTYQHFYIEGPIGCEKVAVEMFAYYALDNMREMIEENETPVLGLQLGEKNHRYFTVDDLKHRIQTLCLEIEQAAFEKKSIHLQYLIKWNYRYFTVLKFYQLHYITRGKTGRKHFCLSDPLTFYQTIFPTAEKASFHYQNNGPFHGGDPCSISNFNMASHLINSAISVAKSRPNWLDVHRLHLLKDLIAQFGPTQTAYKHKGKKIKQVNCTYACWRMLHSPAAQIEYIIHRLQVLHCLIAILADRCQHIKFDQWNKQKTSDNLKMASFCTRTILQTTNNLCQKLKSILTSHVVMVGKTLISVILRSMETVVQEDPNTGFYFPKQDEKALEGVKEIMVMLQSIQDTLSEDAHKACKTLGI